MASNTGENDQALRRILDMTRMISLALLGLHFYYFCYTAFEQWKLVSTFSDRILENIFRTGLFATFNRTKLIALAFLAISLLGAKGKKEEKLSTKTALIYIFIGIIIYFLNRWILSLPAQPVFVSTMYIAASTIGFMLILSGGTMLSRVIRLKINGQNIFNKENETFPQHEQLIDNEYSINLPAKYNLKGKIRKSWINFINPFRGLLVLGSPGSGKSYFVIRHVITQHIRKGFSMFVYDFKFDDLSRITYNTWLENKDKYKVPPQFYVINFDDLSRTHRCNPLDPAGLIDITDAAEAARTILMGLNREWIKRQGDFSVESPINFLTAIIWFLRKYQDGAFCTLPHVVELMQIEQDKLFSVLRTEPEIQAMISPFVSAFVNDATQQLEGQIASAQISMARLASHSLYYVLSGNDFTLDINNPDEPKIVCMGNNPQKLLTYGAVLSLYITRRIKLVNKKGKLKSSLIFDEFPTIYLNHMATNDDLFDKVYFKDDWIPRVDQQVFQEFVALSEGYENIRKAGFDGVAKLLAIKDQNTINQIADKMQHSQTVHSIAQFILKQLIAQTGLLVDEKVLAIRLGIDATDSAGWPKLLEKISEFKYAGIFSEAWPRW